MTISNQPNFPVVNIPPGGLDDPGPQAPTGGEKPGQTYLYEADERTAQLIAQLEHLEAQIKPLAKLKREADAIKDALWAQAVGRMRWGFREGIDSIEVDDGTPQRFSISGSLADRVDEKRLKAEQPNIYAYYSRQQLRRTMRRLT